MTRAINEKQTQEGKQKWRLSEAKASAAFVSTCSWIRNRQTLYFTEVAAYCQSIDSHKYPRLLLADKPPSTWDYIAVRVVW